MVEMPARRATERGFTLVEVLVAFIMAMLILGAVGPLLRLGLVQAQRAEVDALTLGHARSLLARVGGDLPLAAGQSGGDLPQGGVWEVSITPVETIALGPGAADEPEPVLYRVVVRSAAGPGRDAPAITLTTLRLGSPLPAADDRR